MKDELYSSSFRLLFFMQVSITTLSILNNAETCILLHEQRKHSGYYDSITDEAAEEEWRDLYTIYGRVIHIDNSKRTQRSERVRKALSHILIYDFSV